MGKISRDSCGNQNIILKEKDQSILRLVYRYKALEKLSGRARKVMRNKHFDFWLTDALPHKKQ
jgi:hypothetical protein